MLSQEFLQLPVQAIECGLVNISSLKKNKSKYVEQFHDLVDGKELVCRIENLTENGKYLVLILNTERETVVINEIMNLFIENDGEEAAGKGKYVLCGVFLLL